MSCPRAYEKLGARFRRVAPLVRRPANGTERFTGRAAQGGRHVFKDEPEVRQLEPHEHPVQVPLGRFLDAGRVRRLPPLPFGGFGSTRWYVIRTMGVSLNAGMGSCARGND